MKLIKLKLGKRFRSLQPGFELDFKLGTGSKPVSPICFVGRNASGKSNVLEVLASIFQHVDCMNLQYQPEGFDSKKCDPNAFELEYQYRIDPKKATTWTMDTESIKKPIHVRIIKAEKGAPEFFRQLHKSKEWLKVEDKNIIRSMLPDLIVGYSSGQNEILSVPFFKVKFNNYNDYFFRLTQSLDYSQPESRLIYIDEFSSQAVLIANYLMQDPKNFKIFQNELKIKGVKRFQIILNHSRLYDVLVRESTGLTKNKVELTYMLHKSISKLFACSTSYYYDSGTKNFYLDYLIDNNVRRAFQTYFEDALDLFRTFQNLLFLNLYAVPKSINKSVLKSKSIYVNETVPVIASDRRIFRFKDFEIDKEDVEDVIYYKNLSDGEHQFLYIVGTIMMHQRGSILFLLDEPETHFNPKWKYDYLETLERISPRYTTQILITTHDPVMISGLKIEQVVIVEKENGSVIVSRPDKDLKGMGVDAILTSKLFGFSTTLDKETEKLMIERRKLLVEKEKNKSKFKSAKNKRLTFLTEKLSEYDFIMPINEPLYFDYLKALENFEYYSMPFISNKKRKEKEKVKKDIMARITKDPI